MKSDCCGAFSDYWNKCTSSLFCCIDGHDRPNFWLSGLYSGLFKHNSSWFLSGETVKQEHSILSPRCFLPWPMWRQRVQCVHHCWQLVRQETNRCVLWEVTPWCQWWRNQGSVQLRIYSISFCICVPLTTLEFIRHQCLWSFRYFVHFWHLFGINTSMSLRLAGKVLWTTIFAFKMLMLTNIFTLQKIRPILKREFEMYSKLSPFMKKYISFSEFSYELLLSYASKRTLVSRKFTLTKMVFDYGKRSSFQQL